MDPQAHKEWLSHPVTQSFKRFLAEHHKDLLKGWREGQYCRADQGAALQAESEARGRASLTHDLVHFCMEGQG